MEAIKALAELGADVNATNNVRCAICEAVHANALLVRVDLRFNSLDARTRDELHAAVAARSDVRVQLA